MTAIEDLARTHLSGDYTIERVEFMDGDTRTRCIHSRGWSPTNYLQEILWAERGELWVEYYEGDVRRCRDVIDVDKYNGISDWLSGY